LNSRKIVWVLSFIWLGLNNIYSQSPHGESLIIDCSKCHNSENWDFQSQNSFNHDSTSFRLIGQHNDLDCRSCHTSLEFKKVNADCISCHTDFHQQTVGTDCARCHTAVSWIVENMTQLHEQTGFPLMGAHTTINCNDCHTSETNLRFSPINPACITCHQADYASAKVPDHIGQGFPTDCTQCHRQTEMEWSAGGIVHSFFPLEQGHQINDCTICHKNPIYSDINPACIACHNTDFVNAKDPDHRQFPTECNLCHSLAIGWRPASFANHDDKFPIYSGNHKGEWDQCTDCHTTAGSFASFSCIDCHEHNNANDMAKEHDEVSGFQFVSTACFGCHPNGD